MTLDVIKILLVEDNPADADLLQDILEANNGVSFELVHVELLREAVEQLQQAPFEVVLLDLSLPDQRGLDTVKQTRAATPEIPIVVLSGLDDEEIAIAAVRDGAQDYLVKGQITQELLVRALRYAIERGQLLQKLRQSEERYALAIKGANDGIWDWDLKTNEVYFSARWKSLLGYSEDELENKINTWFKLIHPEDLERFNADLTAHLEGKSPYFENEHRLLHWNGDYRWMSSRGLAIRQLNGTAERIAGSLTDITNRKQTEVRLLHGALHDALTGLPNRVLLLDHLKQALERVKRDATDSFAVLFLDLDRFKVINDSLGHTIGDQLLVQLACRLKESLRAVDMVARLGGDEFVILLESLKDTSRAIRVAQRIQERLRQPFALSQTEVFTTASIGIVFGHDQYQQSEDILRDADIAMYSAKNCGKAQYALFDAAMHANAIARLQLETDLRRATECQEFRLHYQPIVTITGEITGFEALLRWQHPCRNLVSPAEFIPLAEETGLIVPIGEWVIFEACRQLKEWQVYYQVEPPLTMSINVSSQQLAQPSFNEKVKYTLQETGLDGSSLKLEITESVIMKNVESTLAQLEDLRHLGVQFYIDDFGKGYSSLSYLHSLPVDALKIDQTFVNLLGADENSWQIIQTIMLLAQGLGLKVIAEGVEMTEQLKRLQMLGCQFVQGYLFSKPLSSKAAADLVSSVAKINVAL